MPCNSLRVSKVDLPYFVKTVNSDGNLNFQPLCVCATFRSCFITFLVNAAAFWVNPNAQEEGTRACHGVCVTQAVRSDLGWLLIEIPSITEEVVLQPARRAKAWDSFQYCWMVFIAAPRRTFKLETDISQESLWLWSWGSVYLFGLLKAECGHWIWGIYQPKK